LIKEEIENMMVKPFEDFGAISKEVYLLNTTWFDYTWEEHWKCILHWKIFEDLSRTD
jgi:hypothetical protein